MPGDEVRVWSQNVQFGALTDGRWETQAEAIRASGASVVLLQELDTIADPEYQERVRAGLGMDLEYCLSVSDPGHRPAKGHTAVAWDPDVWELRRTDTDYSPRLHHSYCGVRLRRRGRRVLRGSAEEGCEVEVPWVFIAAHFTPHSAAGAMQEAQLLVSRVVRAGGLGMLGGDVNHFPELVRGVPGMPDEPDPDFSAMKGYNRASRCLTRDRDTDPWVPDQIVGRQLRDGDLVDVARHLAITRRDPSYLAATGRHGRVRVDQVHVTRAVLPAVTGYAHHPTASDHDGISCRFAADMIDTTAFFDYT